MKASRRASSSSSASRSGQQLGVAKRIGDGKAAHAVLARAEKFAGAAQLQVQFGELKSIGCARECVEPLPGFFGQRLGSNQDAVRFFGPAADASAQLVKLREAEPLGVLNHHNRCVGNVHSHLDDRRGHQRLDFTPAETLHDFFFFFARQPPVEQAQL